MIKKYQNFLNEEVGLKNISKIAKLYKTAEIYFHKDLDGVTSAIAMKEFLKNYYQIETVDCHIIQYGGLEYAVKHHQEGNLCVLVDFAHGKPMFHIATDHHDKQSGTEDTQSTYFKHTRSNVETISGEISYADIFTHEDIELIKTVDSANFISNNIKPEYVNNITVITGIQTNTNNTYSIKNIAFSITTETLTDQIGDNSINICNNNLTTEIKYETVITSDPNPTNILNLSSKTQILGCGDPVVTVTDCSPYYGISAYSFDVDVNTIIDCIVSNFDGWI